MNEASSDLCRRFGIERPVFQAGMGFVTTGRIAGAVSAAGGLGCIATGGVMGTGELREHIAHVRDVAPGRPFAVNLLLPSGADDTSATMGSLDFTRMQLDTCFEEKVPVLISGLGNPAEIIDEVHANGALLVCVVGTVRAALKVARAGADAVVLSGSEAGGHCGEVGTLSLAQTGIPQLKALGVPALLAGGMAGSEAAAAAIALGAAGVSAGTRFLCSVESDAHDRYKQVVVDAGERDTTVTRACTGKPSRAWRNAFVASWEGRESELQPYPEQAVENLWRGQAAALEGDLEEGFFPMGQCAAAIDSVLPAAEVVDLLARPAEAAA